MASGEGTGAAALLLKWLGVDLQFGGEEGDISGKNLLAIFFKCRIFFSFANSLTVLLGSTPCHTENKVWLDCIFMNVCGISGCATTWLELYSACGLPRTIGQSSPHRSCVFHRQRSSTEAEVGDVSLPLASEGELLAFKRVCVLCWSFKPFRFGHLTRSKMQSLFQLFPGRLVITCAFKSVHYRKDQT